MTQPLNPKPGDIVHVRARCVHKNVNGIYLKAQYHGDSSEFVCDVDQILAIEPRPLKVGDRVYVQQRHYKILSIEGRWVWCRALYCDGVPETFLLSALTRIEDPAS